MFWASFRRGWARLAVVALVVGAAARCTQTPTSPSTPGAVLSRGAVPQGGRRRPGTRSGPSTGWAPPDYLAFGDSITFGTLSSFDGGLLFDPPPGTAYPAQLDGLLESSFTTQNFTVSNFGVPGEWAAQAVSSGRFQQR